MWEGGGEEGGCGGGCGCLATGWVRRAATIHTVLGVLAGVW